MGIEPDAGVPAPVVAGLATHGIDVGGYVPGLATAERLASATRIISFGCDLGPLGATDARVEQWADLPMVSDGFETAREAIVARVDQLLTTLSRRDEPRVVKPASAEGLRPGAVNSRNSG